MKITTKRTAFKALPVGFIFKPIEWDSCYWFYKDENGTYAILHEECRDATPVEVAQWRMKNEV